jgi:hypothetical protein
MESEQMSQGSRRGQSHSRGHLRRVSPLRPCPDWDITTPQLSAAWEQGRKELFYPYGKTYAQTIGEQD